jgi:hypothetical protein
MNLPPQLNIKTSKNGLQGCLQYGQSFPSAGQVSLYNTAFEATPLSSNTSAAMIGYKSGGIHSAASLAYCFPSVTINEASRGHEASGVHSFRGHLKNHFDDAASLSRTTNFVYKHPSPKFSNFINSNTQQILNTTSHPNQLMSADLIIPGDFDSSSLSFDSFGASASLPTPMMMPGEQHHHQHQHHDTCDDEGDCDADGDADTDGEPQSCQWGGCYSLFRRPEDLLEHIMDFHMRTIKYVYPDSSKEQTLANRKFLCEWNGCTMILNKKDHLISHVRIHVPCKPYSCSLCNKAFKRKQDVRKHERTRHKNKTSISTASTTTTKKASSAVKKSTIPATRKGSFSAGSNFNPYSAPPRQQQRRNTIHSTTSLSGMNLMQQKQHQQNQSFASGDLMSSMSMDMNMMAAYNMLSTPEFTNMLSPPELMFTPEMVMSNFSLPFTPQETPQSSPQASPNTSMVAPSQTQNQYDLSSAYMSSLMQEQMNLMMQQTSQVDSGMHRRAYSYDSDSAVSLGFLNLQGDMNPISQLLFSPVV